MELFSDLLGEDVIHDPKKNLKQQGIRAKRPDRVIGLDRTAILKNQALIRQDIRCSPFRGDHVWFPFIITEAKNDKNGSGLQHVKDQTAFSIRTLVELQQDLFSDGGNRFSPLVWFFTNRGDVWRLSACVTDGSEFVCFLDRATFHIHLKTH